MSELIFVTGASGFLGSHIVLQLLEKGYRVRAVARGPKVSEVRQRYAKFGDKFEAVPISDIISDQFTDALKGVDAVIHSASPLPGRQEPEGMLKSAVEGTLNIVRQAQNAGIKRIVVTSSIATVDNPQRSFTDQDWNPITKEQALAGNEVDAYLGAKTLAERELWAFGEAHPELDITTVNPTLLYGPFVEGFSLPTPDYAALASNIFIYQVLNTRGGFPPFGPSYVDIREAARAHVLALSSPHTSVVGRKRIILSSPHGFDFKTIISLIAEKRPELKDRLTQSAIPPFPFNKIPADFNRIQQVLGISKDEFRAVEETVLDTVDSLIDVEKVWISKGAEIPVKL